MSAPLATPSLQRRTTLVVLALLFGIVLVVALVTDRVLADRLDNQVRDRLSDRAEVASALADQVDPADLARRLGGEGVSVLVRLPDGTTYADGPLAERGSGARDGSTGSTGDSGSPSDTGSQDTPSTRPGPGGRGGPPPRPAGPADDRGIVETGDTLSIETTVAGDVDVLLLADVDDVARTMTQVRWALVLAGLLVLLTASVAVPLVVRRTMRPLGQMVDVARAVSDGDRARRFHADRPATELGRVAAAFDAVLDDVTGAEQRATTSEARLREFLADAAHELRTPLAGVQAAAEHVLRDDPDRADREQALLMLLRESRRANRLVEDLLLLARIEGTDPEAVTPAGAASSAGPLLVGTAVQDALASRRMRFPDVRWSTEVAADAAVRVPADRLGQVLANLLDNAVHAAGPQARIGVRADVLDTGPGTGPVVRLRVLDDGPGVPVADRERIFDRLVRLDTSRTAATGGAGLGLPIARGLARAHGGDLRCIAPPAGRGACFELTLPAVPAPPAVTTAPTVSPDHPQVGVRQEDGAAAPR